MDVGIVSYGHTNYGVLKQETPELIKTVMDECLANVENGIDTRDIDLIVVSCVDNQFSNQHQTGSLAWNYLKNPDAEAFRVEAACSSGSMAVYIARNMILAGYARNAIVVGFEKMTRVSTETATSILIRGGSPNEVRLGVTQPAAYALMAGLYMQKYGVTEEDFALISVKNHENALRNPRAQFHKRLTVEEVKNSRIIAPPIRLFHCCPISDGAASILLSSEPKKYTDTPVYLKAMAVAHDRMSVFERDDPTVLLASKKAARKVYEMANASPKDIQIAEVHDAFTTVEPMIYEALGFAEEGKGVELVREGKVMFGGEKPVNVSGGLKAKGHPVGATGVGMMIEIFLQLRGEAGEMQVPDVEMGIIENHGGTGSVSIVTLLSR